MRLFSHTHGSRYYGDRVYGSWIYTWTRLSPENQSDISVGRLIIDRIGIMDRRKIIVLLFLYRHRLRRMKRRRQRKYWIHPYIAKRKTLGDFYTKFMNLWGHEDKFFIYFRMSIKSFDELHERLKPSLQRKNTVFIFFLVGIILEITI